MAQQDTPAAGPVMVKVRTTFRPDDVIEVPEDEADLLRQDGLLVEDPAPAADAAPKPGSGKAAAAGGKDIP